MSEQIKKSDIAESDIYGEIRKSAELAEQQIAKLNAELSKSAKASKDVLGKTKMGSASDIKAVETEIAKANKTMAESLRLEKEAERLAKLKEKSRLEEIRLQKAREKSIDDYNRKLEKEAKAHEKNEAQLKKESNAYNQLSLKALKAKNESKRLGAELLHLEQTGKKNTKEFASLTRQYKQATAQAVVMDGQLKKLDKTVGDNWRSVGDYKSALGGLKNVFGALGVGLGLSEAFTGLKDVTTQINTLKISAQQLGFVGQDLENLTKGVSGIAKSFGVDENELLRSANTIIKEFGVTSEVALKQLENGYLSGGNAQGDLTRQVNEYSTQIKSVGGDVGTLMNIISKSNQAGIFSDKGVDAVKEFGLRIREQTTSTTDAMNNAFGKPFTDKIFKGINDGSMTSIEALEEISKKMNDASIPTNKLQTVIADVFGGPGEDAGLGFLQTLTDITSQTNNLVDSTDPLVRQQQETLRLNKQLADSQYQFSEALGGTGTTIDQLIIKAKIFFFENLIPASKIIGRLILAFGIFKGAMLALKLQEQFKNWKALRTEIAQTGTATTEAGKSAKGFGNALKGIGITVAIGLLTELEKAFD
jgi:myosin heavy subunit